MILSHVVAMYKDDIDRRSNGSIKLDMVLHLGVIHITSIIGEIYVFDLIS